MGLWELFTGARGARGPKVEVGEDLVWMDDRAKFQGVAKGVSVQLGECRLVIATAHFPRTLATMVETLERNGQVAERISGRLFGSDVSRLADGGQGGRLIAVLADALQPQDPAATAGDDSGPIAIIVAERHFLRERDEAIVGFARGLGRSCRVRFHLALTDPLLDQFAGAWVRQVLTQLGMGESEAVESLMVSRRLRDAQRKLASRITGDQSADSAEEWLRRNAPQANNL